MSTGDPYLQIRDVHKSFGSFKALSDISLDIYEGEFVCFLGPSGCGKTTLLRILAGLEMQDQGQIIQAEQDVSQLPPARRDFGIVFQSYALFPNLTAAKNIAYGLQNKRMGRKRIQARVKELLELVGLPEAGKKYPAQLSGGQQQRIALARALALSPGLLLLDEPLSALDARVRASLRQELAALQRRLGVTTIMVTHDQEEALTMADRIVVMDHGVIRQIGSPLDIYRVPQTPFVANFIGEMNFLQGDVVAPGEVRCHDITFKIALPNGESTASKVQLAIRPEEIKVAAHPNESVNVVQAALENTQFLGSYYRLKLSILNSQPHLGVIADLPSQLAHALSLEPASVLHVHFPMSALRVYQYG